MIVDNDARVTRGGVHLYRATAECSACGLVVDVGPFDSLSQSVRTRLGGWLLNTGPGLTWALRDAFGCPVTLCDGCMGRPLRDTLADITERARELIDVLAEAATHEETNVIRLNADADDAAVAAAIAALKGRGTP